MIYRIVLAVVIIAVFIFLLRLVSFKQLILSMIKNLASVRLLFASQKEDKKRKMDFNLLRTILLNLSILLLCLLALTSFLPVLFGYSLTGIFLVLHVMIAPVFVFVFTLAIIFWADKMKFKQPVDFESADSKNRLYFWLFLLASVPAILSIILEMYPLFGMESMHVLYELHKYSTLILFIILSLFILNNYSITKKSTGEK